MAEIIDVPVLDLDLSGLQAEAEETGKTIKDLKDEIKGFRESLENAEIGSDDFKSALEQLTNAQNELKQATKSSIDVVEGSYNALTRQMAEMKAEWKNLNPATEEGKARMAELGKAINDTNNKLKEMDASLGNYQRNVGNYGSAFEGVTMKIDGTTASFERQIHTTQSALDSFQLIEGALQTMGIESEKAEKVLRSVEGAMKFTQGLTAIKEAAGGFKELGIATKAAELQQKLFGASVKSTAAATTTATVATNTFKKALVSTGIGALIVGLGVLIANFDKILALFNKNASEAEKASESFGKFKTELEDTARGGATELEIMGAKGATAMQLLQEEIRQTATSLETLKTQSEDLKQKLSEAKWWQFGLKKELKKEIEEVDGMIEETTDKQKDLSEEVKVQQVKDSEDAKKAISKNLEESQKAVDKIKDRLSKLNLSAPAINLRSLNDQLKKDIDEIDKAFKRGAISYGEYLETLASLDEEYISNRNKLVNNLIEGYNTELMTDEEKSLNDLNQWKQEQLKIWADMRAEIEKTGTETDLTIFAEREKEALEKVNQIYQEKDEEIKKMVKENGWKKIVDDINKELDKLDKVRERAIQKLALTEVAINEEFKDFDFDLSIDFKFDTQEEKLKKLKVLYENQLETLKQIDAKERERIESLIKQAEEQGRSAEEIEDLRWQLEQVGGETDALVQRIGNVNDALQTLTLDKLVAQVESISSLFTGVGDSLMKLNEIGNAFSSETASGINETISQIADGMNQAAVNFSQIGKIQEELTKLQEEGADSAKLQKLQTELAAKQWKTYGQMATAGLGAASSMLSALAAQQDQQDDEGFEKMKKLQIASATMSMLQGVVSAITSAMSPANAWMTIYGQAGAAAAMSAMVIATGTMQINAIKKMTKNSTGTPAPPDVASINIPQATASQSMTPAVQTVNAVEGASTESNTKDNRVYVVETDISSTQDKVKVIESEATY